MAKELSIATIKKEFMDALLNNVQIINSFGKYEDIKKTTDYINRNIFNHLNSREDYAITDKFVNFDVSYEKDSYRVIIIVKVHRDLFNITDDTNCLDVMCSSIREIIDELYPYCVGYSDRPVRRGDYYVERQITFTLYEEKRKQWIRDNMKVSDEETNHPIEWVSANDFNKCKSCPHNEMTFTIRKAIESEINAIESEINAKNACSPCNVSKIDLGLE